MNSNDKIEQYLLLAKGLHGLALSNLITKATAEPGLFTFGELLILPQVQQVIILILTVNNLHGSQETSRNLIPFNFILFSARRR
jgi:hypothetical protein